LLAETKTRFGPSKNPPDAGRNTRDEMARSNILSN
jgi:hypothetical protein